MRTDLDLAPFRRSSVGFDRLFDLLENGSAIASGDGWPPFDIEHDGGEGYRITLAIPGYRQDEIEIIAQPNLLVVSGRKPEEGDRRHVHRGIAGGSFERRFALGDYVQVRGAELRDGLLSIALAREIPDEMKPHRIEIGRTPGKTVADDAAGGDGARDAA